MPTMQVGWNRLRKRYGQVAVMKSKMTGDIKVAYILIYAALAILIFLLMLLIVKADFRPVVDIPQETVTINETWVEDTYYNGKWFIVSLIIGETNQRQFQFRSIDSADAWLKSLLASPKYDVTVRDWFYVHGKE
jgi:hypothetical protein